MNINRTGNKRGNYIVESAICLPMAIVALMVLFSVILMYSCIEDANYIAASEVRRASVEGLYKEYDATLPFRIDKRVKSYSQVKSINITEYGYKCNKWANDEIIAVRYNLFLETSNPIGIASSAKYTLSCASRAYVGKIRDVRNMTAEEFEETGDETVLIFPKAGERYHRNGCSVLKSACRLTSLSSDVKRQYSSCRLCKSEDATLGTAVYIFPSDGKSYHLPGCGTLERNFIEIMKKTARDRGYTPCLKCGG